jgi:long-chain acyl-CoA synthetase
VFEAVHAGVLREPARGGAPRRRVARAALKAGREAAARRADGRRLGPWLSLRLRVADRLVLSKVRARLGGRLRHAISGGARLPPETAGFFEAVGVPILEGYGLTECTTVAAVSTPDRRRAGTVGPPLPGIEVRLAPDGEVLVRGETVFAGYYRDEEATRECLAEDGWLRTGDLGALDADGLLTITDRKKDIIVTSDGHNVSPQRVEAALRASPLVSEALVVGHGRPYLVALLAPDVQALRTAGDARSALAEVVAAVNRSAGPAERVRAFAVLPRELRAEEGEITPTLKVRRHVCEDHFRDLIASLYAAPQATGSGPAQPL